MASRIFTPGLLDGRICVVSGAGTGIGKATALELAGLGATVIGCGRRTVPLGRMGTEDEMAWLLAFLASPAGDFFSGCVITIDGARDNWFGTWPPTGATGASGEPLAEERREPESSGLGPQPA